MLEEMFYNSDNQVVTVVEIREDLVEDILKADIPLDNVIVRGEDEDLLILPGFHVGTLIFAKMPESVEQVILKSPYIATVSRDSERWDFLMTDLCQRYSTVGEDHGSLLKEDRIVTDTLLSESMRVDEGEKE